MPRRIPLSRAAQLVGVKRGELQKQIQDGLIPAFEGSVELADLLRIYPNTQMHDTTMLEHVKNIVEHSISKRHRTQQDLPPAEVLSARVTALAEELVAAKNTARWYAHLVEQMQARFAELQQVDCDDYRRALGDLRGWFFQQLESQPVGLSEAADQLRVKERFLRTMTANVQMSPSGHEFAVEGTRTILEAGLQAGIPLEYGCNNGSCGLCRARVTAGEVSKLRHHDYVLSEAEKNQGYCLMCSYTPLSDIKLEAHVARGPADLPLQRVKTKVQRIELLGDEVVLLQLRTPRTKRLRFFAGQHATLTLASGASGDFAIASCPCDEMNIELHVPLTEATPFAQQVCRLKKLDEVTIEGPKGTFVLDEASVRPLIFIACDTGFAPAKSLIEHAMALEKTDETHLYWVSLQLRGHYLNNLARAWADSFDGFRYTPLRVDPLGPGNESHRLEALLKEILIAQPNLEQFDLYLTGSAPFLKIASDFFRTVGYPQAQLHIESAA
ncbi:MAG: 2Fe-2S iron-sulfur cluster-binding protein [Thiotrichales bacterium]